MLVLTPVLNLRISMFLSLVELSLNFNFGYLVLVIKFNEIRLGGYQSFPFKIFHPTFLIDHG